MGVNPISSARFKLAYERPYLATAIWALNPVETPGLGTLAVDKYWRLYYDPAVHEKWNVDELVSVLYHEINHLLRDHAARGETSDNMVFNIAADAEINDDIDEEGAWQLPKGCVQPESFGEARGKLAEYYYDKLMKNAKNIKPGKQAGAGKCGSAATGQSQGDHEQGDPGDNGGGMGKTESDLMKRQVAKEIEQASQSRGNVPGHLERWAKDQLEVKVDWRKQMAAAVRQSLGQKSGSKDFTYRRPSRRGPKDIIMPSTFQPVPNVAVYIDTSGSMGTEQVTQAVEELGGILKSQGASSGVTVAAVDAQIQTAKRVFSKKNVDLRGGGGTDMGCALIHAEASRPRPDICIVLTDGYTDWPKERPQGMKVIIGLIPMKGYGKQKLPATPAYATRVEIVDE